MLKVAVLDEPSSSTAPEEDDPPPEMRESFGHTVREMGQELYGARELLLQMTVRDLKLRYKQSIMGVGWAIFMPLLIVGAGCLVRAAMAQVAGLPLRNAELAGMAIKAVPWAFFVGSLSFAVVSLTTNLNLVTKIYFPREVFPLSAVLTQAVDSFVGGVAVSCVLLYLQVPISWQMLWAIPMLLLIALFTMGMALLLACGNLFFRDVKYLVQILLNFGIFFTPVFYEPAGLGETIAKWMMLNPLTPMLEGLRIAVVEHHSLLEPFYVMGKTGVVLIWHPLYLAYAVGWALVSFTASWYLFHKLEFVYAEYI